MYTTNELENIFDTLLKVHQNKVVESEIVEFKEATNGFSTDKLGKYFSALSNEANLCGTTSAWIIFGVSNQGKLLGTNYLINPHTTNEVKKEISDKTSERIGLRGVYQITRNEKRIVMIEIPPAPLGNPVSYEGHYYERVGESLVALSPEKRRRIEGQIQEDWSLKTIDAATLDDLDPAAIEIAREKYAQKYPNLADEMKTWDTITFLNKAKLTVRGKITNTAVILLGKSESEYLLSPSQVKIKWILKNSNEDVRDYMLVSCPLLISVEDIYRRIINLKYRYIQAGTLFPSEVDQYDSYVIRESLNNAIAHQDYTQNGAITIVQTDDTLSIKNLGSFIPESVEQVILANAPETRIRNTFLASAMFNLMMVDTIGSGIKRMFTHQKDRYFPLPDYTLAENSVEISVMGRVLDLKYANVLAKDKSLSLQDIIMLDKVQKQKPLSDREIQYLRSKKLIEGRKPNFIISSSLAATTNQKIDHAKKKGLTTSAYETIILESLQRYKCLTRKDINGILYDVLPTNLTEKQKNTKVNHLLSHMRKTGKIFNAGTTAKPKWRIVKE